MGLLYPVFDNCSSEYFLEVKKVPLVKYSYSWKLFTVILVNDRNELIIIVIH